MSIKIKIAVLFGGRSPEHEVSIISGIQILNAINKDKYEVVPVYITKEGQWIRGDINFFDPKFFKNLEKVSSRKKVILSTDPSNSGLILEPDLISISKRFNIEKIDVAFPVFHGRFGEDGSIQGLFEMAGIPYVGCDVQASSVGMDKVVSKRIAKTIGVPVLPDRVVIKNFWVNNRNKIIKEIKSGLKFPVFIKPARLGSSIGLNKAHTIKELEEFLEVAFFYDTKVMVEQSLEGAKEVNISILGNNPYKVSVCEMPISTGEVLSFSEKYTSKKGPSKGMASAKRLIPAPIKASTKEKIEQYAKLFFAEIGGQGMARIDFLISKSENVVYLNEINTLPGSFAFYLWKEVGVDFEMLTDKLINLALQRAEEKKKLISTFKSNILEGFGGVKGIKS